LKRKQFPSHDPDLGSGTLTTVMGTEIRDVMSGIRYLLSERFATIV